LDGFTLSIPRGVCFGLLGPPGSGKSTFLAILQGRLQPDSGWIRRSGDLVISDGEIVSPCSGTTYIMASRNLADLEPVCGEIAILRAGHVAAAGSLADLRTARGFRLVAGELPDRVQEELAQRGFLVRAMAQSCWIEGQGPSRSDWLIDYLRQSRISIESLEKLPSDLEKFCF
jgi:ABC-type multidrug transport system ATPase subunit